MAPKLPASGLYRTIFALPGAEREVPAQSLIQLQFDADSGDAVVATPTTSERDRWSFALEVHTVRDPWWLAALVHLPREGVYQLGTLLHIGNGGVLPADLLVRVGYTRAGHGVIFPGMITATGGIEFDRRGVLVSDLQLDTLKRCAFKLLARATDGRTPTDTDPDVALPDEWDS